MARVLVRHGLAQHKPLDAVVRHAQPGMRTLGSDVSARLLVMAVITTPRAPRDHVEIELGSTLELHPSTVVGEVPLSGDMQYASSA